MAFSNKTSRLPVTVPLPFTPQARTAVTKLPPVPRSPPLRPMIPLPAVLQAKAPLPPPRAVVPPPVYRPVAQPKLVRTATMPTIQLSSAHTTRKGVIKPSSLSYLKDLPKGAKPVDVVNIWEVHHKMLDGFAVADIDPLPPNTTGVKPKRLDMAALKKDYFVLGTLLAQAIADAPANDRGDHGNDEGKLPVYAGATPYKEYGFFKKGGRLVIDATSGRQYISLHYSTFYRVV